VLPRYHASSVCSHQRRCKNEISLAHAQTIAHQQSLRTIKSYDCTIMSGLAVPNRSYLLKIVVPQRCN
jgi:hypothetical protein